MAASARPFLAQTTQTASTGWEVVAWIALGEAFACAGAILWDILSRGYRQHMGIMNWVWPISALYWGPVALWFYFWRGRRMSQRWAHEHRVDMHEIGMIVGYFTSWPVNVWLIRRGLKEKM